MCTMHTHVRVRVCSNFWKEWKARNIAHYFLHEREKSHLAQEEYLNTPLSKKKKGVLSKRQVHTTGGEDKYIRIQKKRGSIQIGVTSVDA